MKKLLLRLGLGALLLCICACQSVTPRSEALPLDNLKVGVAPFSQPVRNTELMAGYIPQPQGKISPEELARLDALLAAQLGESKLFTRNVPPTAMRHVLEQELDQPQSALARWVSLAKAQNVDLLLVPQILSWRERDGGDYGVVSPAAIDMDIFLVDARGEGRLLQRTHFAEEQKALSDNLLGIGLFLERGGRWITAQQMAAAAIKTALKEFGL